MTALITDALQELVDAVEPKLGTMNYYFGPGARTVVSQTSVVEYRRIAEAVKKAREVLADAESHPLHVITTDPYYDGRICDDGSACMAPNCPCAERLPKAESNA